MNEITGFKRIKMILVPEGVSTILRNTVRYTVKELWAFVYTQYSATVQVFQGELINASQIYFFFEKFTQDLCCSYIHVKYGLA